MVDQIKLLQRTYLIDKTELKNKFNIKGEIFTVEVKPKGEAATVLLRVISKEII